MTHTDGLARPARSAEEDFYRTTLIEQFDRPAKLLPLVTHWDDDARIDDNPIVGSAAVSVISNHPQRARNDCDVGINDFSALYDLPTPRPYFQRMAQIDYCIPGAASGIFAWCIDELRRQRDTGEVRVLDLCAGYGVNGALMKTDLSLDALYGYFIDQRDTGPAFELFDRTLTMAHAEDHDVHVTGLDVASRALDYACSAGFMDEGYAVDLESDPLPAKLARSVTQSSVISITGGFSFIGATTFDKILSSFPRESARLPWIVGFPLLHTSLEPLFEVLRDYGYVIKPDTKHRFLQRQFANKRERDTEHAALAAAGINIVEAGYLESRLLLAQPPGMPSIPDSILTDAAGYARSTTTVAVGA